MCNLLLCHWSSQLFDLCVPSSTDIPILLLNQFYIILQPPVVSGDLHWLLRDKKIYLDTLTLSSFLALSCSQSILEAVLQWKSRNYVCLAFSRNYLFHHIVDVSACHSDRNGECSDSGGTEKNKYTKRTVDRNIAGNGKFRLSVYNPVASTGKEVMKDRPCVRDAE